MIKRLSIILMSIVLMTLMVSCKPKYANVLFDENNYSSETINEWHAEIQYISENRGTFDETYTIIKSNPDNSYELITLIDMFYGASVSRAPDDIFFSAEGMSDYMFNFYKTESEEPILSFYYWRAGNLLTRAMHRYDEKKQTDIIDYEFYVPHGDLGQLAAEYRIMAKEPDRKITGLSLNPKQLIASVEQEEINERLGDDAALEFEFYTGYMPNDEGTACKLYDSGDIPDLEEGKVVIMARIAGETGEALNLNIYYMEYNDYYTIVSVSYPNEELQAEMGIKTSNAIILNEAVLDRDKHIVFIDDDGKVVYVIVPFAG